MTPLLNFECHRLAFKHSSPSRKPYDAKKQGHGEPISFLAEGSNVCSKINKNPLPSTHVIDVSYRNVSPNALFAGVKHLPTEYVMELNYKGNSLGSNNSSSSEWSLPHFLDKVSCVFPNLQHLHLDHGSQQQHGYTCQLSSQRQDFYLRLYILFRMPDLKSINGIPVTAYEQKLARPSHPSGVPISSPQNPAHWIHLKEFSEGHFSQENMDKRKSSPHSTTTDIIEPLILCAREDALLTFGEEDSEKTYLGNKQHYEEVSASLPSSPPSLRKSKPAFTRNFRSIFPTLESRLQEVTVKCFTNEISTKEDSLECNDYSQDIRLGHEQEPSCPQMVQVQPSAACMQPSLHPDGSLTFIHPPKTRKKMVTFQADTHGSKANMTDGTLIEPQMDLFCKKDISSLSFHPSPLPTITEVMRRKRDQWRKRQNFSRKQVCPSESVLTLNYSSEEDEQQSYEC
jgi:hypothetical protein